MDNEKRKILVLVEGNKTDYKLMEHLLGIYGISEHHTIVPYHTNIYTLYQEMFQDGDPDSIDLLQNLKEHENDPQLKRLFEERYSDILLIFDLDPQDPQFSEQKITEMLAYFTESSDMGKLYLNYPMVEAFYHMKSIPDPQFDTYMVSMEELRAGQYKRRVNRENRNHDYRKFATTKEECNAVITQNISKAWQITASDDIGLSHSLFSPPEAAGILANQLAQLRSNDSLSVLCTCAFYISDYNPNLLK